MKRKLRRKTIRTPIIAILGPEIYVKKMKRAIRVRRSPTIIVDILRSLWVLSIFRLEPLPLNISLNPMEKALIIIGRYFIIPINPAVAIAPIPIFWA